MEEEKEKGLSVTTVWLMISTALFLDALQALLTLVWMGWAVTLFAVPIFWLWFKYHGIHIGFSKPKRILSFAGTSLLEIFPLFPVWLVPTWTIFVAALALQNKLQKVIPGADITKLDIMKR